MLWGFDLTSVTLSLDETYYLYVIFDTAKGGGLIYRK